MAGALAIIAGVIVAIIPLFIFFGGFLGDLMKTKVVQLLLLVFVIFAGYFIWQWMGNNGAIFDDPSTWFAAIGDGLSDAGSDFGGWALEGSAAVAGGWLSTIFRTNWMVLSPSTFAGAQAAGAVKSPVSGKWFQHAWKSFWRKWG